jgi:RNA polymerase sigma factor (sigma-70 family)
MTPQDDAQNKLSSSAAGSGNLPHAQGSAGADPAPANPVGTPLYVGGTSCPIDTPTLLRMAKACGVPRQDRDDLVQKVWQYTLPRLAQLRTEHGDAGMRCWIFKVIRHKALDMFRQRRRRIEDLDALVRAGKEPNDPAQEPEVMLAERWQQEALEQALRELEALVSPRDYRIAVSFIADHASVKDIVAVESITEDHVYVVLHRLRKKLRRLSVE